MADTVRYEATLDLGVSADRTYVTITTSDRKILVALVDAVEEAHRIAHHDGSPANLERGSEDPSAEHSEGWRPDRQ